jgi:histidinol-phosphate/aromatic aminotransferase/cobyric acid decarboxylase-like protein
MDKPSEYTGAAWSIQAVEKLKELWNANVPADMIAETLARPEHVVRAKAAELGLPQHVEAA